MTQESGDGEAPRPALKRAAPNLRSGSNGAADGAVASTAPPSVLARALPSYRLHWALIFGFLAVLAWWTFQGAALLRRRGLEQARVPEALRTESHYLVASFPRVTRHGRDSTLRQDRFEEIVAELHRRGYHAIGLRDLHDLYAGRGALPPKSILLALERDNPESVGLVERSLRRRQWKGVVFMDRSAFTRKGDIRRALSEHAVDQMVRGGGWDFGTAVFPGSVPPVEGLGRGAVLWGLTPKAVDLPEDVPVRMRVSKTGYNDLDIPLTDVRAFVVRPEAGVNETVAALEAFQPRTAEFLDLFRGEKLGPDWVADWGIISATRERIAVLPQPFQRTASVTLKGTDRWSDSVVEFSLLRHRGEAWLQARTREPERWVRIGVEGGFWRLQQKAGPAAKPQTLAMAPLEGLPATMRLILKGNWAIVYHGEKVHFGKGLWVDSAVNFGRLQLIAQGVKPGTSKAVFGFVRTWPLEERWLAFDRSPESSPELLGAVRGRAAEAKVLSPRWVVVGARGVVNVSPPDETSRALAGFYRCKLIPTVTFSGWPRPEDFRPTAAALATVAESLGVPGLNLRLPPDAPGGEALSRELKAALWRRRRLLWVTARTRAQADAWRQNAEAVLRSGGRTEAGIDVLRRWSD